ncbi:Tll0287-like domain-containing protein [Sulfuricurvum sp.]|uniref:Tll0287-like domain-containing protein n=1 Tax=Sulfuricurvum sp. TaxID=2025608 RepID=UPI003C542F7D
MRHFPLLSLFLTSTLLTASPLSEEQMVTKGSEASALLLQKLGGELKNQMQTNGSMGALHFCSQNALTLTEQIAKESKTSIKRISINNRNPVNKANKDEIALLNEWDKLVKNGQPLPAQKLVKVSDSTIMYYKPIVINNEACLKCHGNVEGALAKAIHTTYPEDKATGYKMGDLRGMIAITIKRD